MTKQKCRWCEYSKRKSGKWVCSQGVDTSKPTEDCEKFYCGERDKINGVSNRKSKCFICGRPVYSHGKDTPIYCIDHREYAERDEGILLNAPLELLFPLISGIFSRAREDYIFDSDGKKSDAGVFFRSKWAQELSLNGFDADEVFRLLEEEIANES